MIKKRKISRLTLDQLADVMPVLTDAESSQYRGGGDGSAHHPYTQYEYQCLSVLGNWHGGYVRHSGGLTYVTASNPSAGFTPTGIYQQDRMYTAGYINGYRVGKSPSKWDDFWTGALFLLSQAGASGTPGGERTDPVMTMYNAGVMSGYLDGLRNQK